MLEADLWGRVGSNIQNAARQLEGERRGWIFVEDAGASAWGTPWSRSPLELKLEDLIGPLRRELAAASHAAGVIFTTGPRNPGDAVVEQTVWSDGCVALRRALIGRRSRETFIIRRNDLQPPQPGIWGVLGHADAVALYQVFDTEGVYGRSLR